MTGRSRTWRRQGSLLTAAVVSAFVLVAPTGPGAAAVAGQAARQAAGTATSNPFCAYLGLDYQASSGAWAFCFGARPTGSPPSLGAAPGPAHRAPANVDAADLAEDISPGGVRAYGQSGPSIAAAGRYVVEAWTDATGLFATCPSARDKEELTGLGFSANGGSSFTDLGGLHNPDCTQDVYGGDPSVVAYETGGHIYFYVLSLYNSPTGLGPSDMALAACQATGTGHAAKLTCGHPVVVATSSACKTVSAGVKFCSFLDKGFMTVDPVHGRLYISYAEFPYSGAGSEIQLAVCDIGNSTGGRGPAGGRPAAPVCENGARTAPAKPYLTIASSDPAKCENEGAYPAVDSATGTVYVGYEYNWGTNINGGAVPPCGSIPTKEVLTEVPPRCLPLTAVSPCKGPTARATTPVTSLAAAAIPGYDGPPNDFPRLAVSPRSGTVSMVWNDARYDPLGDILLQSFSRGSLRRVQRSPVVLNRSRGGVHILPALRSADDSGLLEVSWFSRSSAAATRTNVMAALGVSPRAQAAPARNTLVTTVASNWGAASSDLTPDFGDYTDNALITTGEPPYVGRSLFIAWTDGRLGLPQPFAAHLPAG